MESKIKEVIREMILDGEIKIDIQTSSGGLHKQYAKFTLSVDGDTQDDKHCERIQYEY